MRQVVRPWRDPVFLGFLLLGLALLGASAACWQRATDGAAPLSEQVHTTIPGPGLAVLSPPAPVAPMAAARDGFELPF